MEELERAALSSLHVNWALTADDVWEPMGAHVDGLNDDVARVVLGAYGEAETSGKSPIGVVITGANGSGKTHMVRWIRTQVQRRGGYFLPLVLHSDRNFWLNVVYSLITALRRGENGSENQLHQLVHRLADKVGVPAEIRTAVTGSATNPDSLDEFAGAVRRSNRRLGAECRHTLRALLMLASDDMNVEDLGESLLTGGEITKALRTTWGLSTQRKSPRQVVSELSQLLAFTGPCLVAVDQIDALLEYSGRAADPRAGKAVAVGHNALPEQVGTGLMDLRETMSRTVTVVACLPGSWEQITDHAGDAVRERFRQATRLDKIPSTAVGKDLVEAHFALRYATVRDFRPPFPSWPVQPAAFADAPQFTPRGLLTTIDGHIRSCLSGDSVVLLSTLSERPAVTAPAGPSFASADSHAHVAGLDAQFKILIQDADIAGAQRISTEDKEMPPLLEALLAAWIQEQGPNGVDHYVTRSTSPQPPLHATLCKVIDQETEAKQEWAFRSLSTNQWNAVEVRVNRAKEMSGVTPGGLVRAFLLLPGAWKPGQRAKAAVTSFTEAGGEPLTLDPADLRTAAALAHLNRANPPGLAEWIRLRRPAGRSALLRAVFGDPDTGPAAMPDPAPPPDIDPPADDGDPQYTLPLGISADTGAPVRVTLKSLCKHTAIFAGSGSGKTVLIRRIVEECALRGVSSIVLDPNNDLARLGDPWPAPPQGWGPDDETAAREYLDNTDVMIWTPRRTSGRPLSFQPLPDFAPSGMTGTSWIWRWTPRLPHWPRAQRSMAAQPRRSGAGRYCAKHSSTSRRDA